MPLSSAASRGVPVSSYDGSPPRGGRSTDVSSAYGAYLLGDAPRRPTSPTRQRNSPDRQGLKPGQFAAAEWAPEYPGPLRAVTEKSLAKGALRGTAISSPRFRSSSPATGDLVGFDQCSVGMAITMIPEGYAQRYAGVIVAKDTEAHHATVKWNDEEFGGPPGGQLTMYDEDGRLGYSSKRAERQVWWDTGGQAYQRWVPQCSGDYARAGSHAAQDAHGVPFTFVCTATVAGDSVSVRVSLPRGSPQPNGDLTTVAVACDAALDEIARRKGVVEPFRTRAMHVYDRKEEGWVPLADPQQLLGARSARDRACLQPCAHVHAEQQEADRTMDADVSFDDKVRVTYQAMEHAPGGGGFSLDAFRARLAALGVHLSGGDPTQREVFAAADTDMNGLVCFDEWRDWAQRYPNTLDCVYWRGVAAEEGARLRREVDDAASRPVAPPSSAVPLNPAALRAREQQLLRELEEVRTLQRGGAHSPPPSQPPASDAGHVDAMLARLRNHQSRTAALGREEQDLIDSEVRLERQRAALRRHERAFTDAAAAFDRSAAASSSPRRAEDSPRRDRAPPAAVRRQPSTSSDLRAASRQASAAVAVPPAAVARQPSASAVSRQASATRSPAR